MLVMNTKKGNEGRKKSRSTSTTAKKTTSKTGEKSKAEKKANDFKFKSIIGKEPSSPSGKSAPKGTRFIDNKKRVAKGDPMPNVNAVDIRLNKYLSNAGICSRREADVLIQTGVVTVNDEIILELGYKVKPGDRVRYDGETINAEKKQYVLLNKPKDFITTMDDPWGRKTVMSLVAKACKERVYPVGRLDRETTGLLLFTNDGDMSKKLTHPRHKCSKIYHVELNKPVKLEDVNRLTTGLELEDGKIIFDKAEYVKDNPREIGVELHSGKNRIVRRSFEAMGYDVVRLDRVQFAGLTKKDLPRGHYRHLTEKEIAFLKMS